MPLGCASDTAPTSSLSTPARVSSAQALIRVEPWDFEGRPGRVLITPHYRIFTTLPENRITSALPAFLEEAMGFYTTAFGQLPYPQTALDTYVMATKPQWTRLTQRFLGTNSATPLMIPRGGFAYQGRALFFDIGPSDTFAIAAHEGWHQYVQRAFQDPLPVWLDEGLATLAEGYRWGQGPGSGPMFLPWANLERADALRAAVGGGRLMPLEKILTTSPSEMIQTPGDASLVYYAQVWALAHFLREGDAGRLAPRLAAMLQDAQRGRLVPGLVRQRGTDAARAHLVTRTGPALFELWFGSLSERSGQYDAFVREIVSVGSRNRIVLGESPLKR
ncbi:MAG: hypothetical protein SFZ23_13690 [Planctomycetota bacterium]|nr:hypothetical protein [Planctomycetota bacterium]